MHEIHIKPQSYKFELLRKLIGHLTKTVSNLLQTRICMPPAKFSTKSLQDIEFVAIVTASYQNGVMLCTLQLG